MFATYCWVCPPFSGRYDLLIYMSTVILPSLCAYQFFFRNDESRFSGFLIPNLVHHVLSGMSFFGGVPSFTYLYIYSHSALCRRLPIFFVLIHQDFWAFFSTNLVSRVYPSAFCLHLQILLISLWPPRHVLF